MKVTRKQFNPIQIELETPEEVSVVVIALRNYAQYTRNYELRNLANTLHNEIMKHSNGNS